MVAKECQNISIYLDGSGVFSHNSGHDYFNKSSINQSFTQIYCLTMIFLYPSGSYINSLSML